MTLAITGLGSDNLLNVEVDLDARMDMKDLDKQLEACLTQKRGIYAVVAIMGSTEHGACDPLKDIIKLREKVRVKSLVMVCYTRLTCLKYCSIKKRVSVSLYTRMVLGEHTIVPC